MRPVAWSILLCLFPTLGGCHVTDKAEQCRTLATLVKKSRPGLQESAIPESPTPAQLLKRARLYGQLGADLKGVELDDREVEKERDKVLAQLSVLEAQLKSAAVAVEEYQTVSKEEEEEKRQAEVAAESADLSPAPEHRVVQGLIRSPSKKPPIRARALAKVRDYSRSKSSAESAGRGLSAALDRLQRACH